MFKIKQLYLIVLGVFGIIAPMQAAVINIPIIDEEFSQSPASDLVYQNSRIDPEEALKLKITGYDLSRLNPYESNLWGHNKLPLKSNVTYKETKQEFRFLEYRTSPTEIFRAFVLGKNKRYSITASLDNHTNIIRAALLRMLGYDIELPRILKPTWIKFRDDKEKKKFIELLGEQTLTNKKRWIEDERELALKIRHLIITPAKLNNVNIYLPLMSRSRQKEKRVFRSLITLYSLTDFPEAINKISWKVGKVFNNHLTLTHPYANNFKDTTIDDVKWMNRKLCSFKNSDIEKAIKLASYPKSVEALVFEKMKSRIVSLAKTLKLNCHLKVNKKITNKYIKNGKLTIESFSDSAINYGASDVQSPYRFSELFRLFRTQAVYSSLSSLLTYGLEKALPGAYQSDATTNIAQQIGEFRKENPGNGMLPVKVFSAPVAFGKLFATRNIVFGQYLGTNAAIQLVDSVGAEVNLGLQNSITGLDENILPNIGVSTALTRTYSHVRAMPDLKTASKQKVSKILVPRLLKKLGRILRNEYICSISEKPYVEEATISNETFYYIKYDPDLEDSFEQAKKKREELIKQGLAANKILFVKIDRETLCIDEITEERDRSIQDFLKSFAENETFIISDSLKFTGLSNIPIPLLAGLNLSLTADHTRVKLRSIILRKKEGNIQVTLQEQKSNGTSFTESLSFYIQLASNTDQFQKGKSHSKVFNISLENSDKEKIAIKTIRNLFVRNNKELLYANYKAKELDHKVRTYLNTFRLLWFKKERFRMKHELEFVIPNKESENFSLSQRSRRFYHTVDFKRSGSDFHSFVNGILGYFSKFISLGSSSQDPGKTFSGSSKKIFISTEAELTKDYPLNPTTRIEFIRSGWNKKVSRVQKYLDEINERFSFSKSYTPIDNSFLHGASKLQSYDFRTTIILYPGALERAVNKISKNPRIINYLRNKQSPKVTGLSKRIKKVVYKLSQSFKNPKEKIHLINKLYSTFFFRFDVSKVLHFLGEKNFFATTRITGFRKDHHTGFLEYNGDTLGNYNTDIGTGILDSLGAQFNISSFELRALNYSPGM